jgi:pimeloyl-ACP methyl ester carboxylesterase
MQVQMNVRTSRIERTWFAYYDPFPPRDEKGFLDGDKKAPIRGLVVILPGMFGTPPDQIGTMTRRLRNEGFAVLRMLAHPSLFTEHVSFAVPMQGPVDAAAKDIARELSGRTAEVAYAIESALAHVMTQRPEIIDKKLGFVGMSGGAMVAPTVVARNPKLFERVVLIGGGADYLQILLESNYREWIDAVEVLFFEGAPPKGHAGNDQQGKPLEPIKADEPAKPGSAGFRLVTKGPSADQRRAELLAAYRRLAPLDSANLAPSLAGTSVLMVQATTDRAVPRVTGDLLWEKADKPERIMVSGGHEWLFFTLNRHMDRMTNFLAMGLDPAGQQPRAPAAAESPSTVPAAVPATPR